MSRSDRKRAPEIAADRDGQEQAVRESGLDLTLVKPPRLKDGPPPGRLRAGGDLHVGMLSAVRRQDLAEFICGELASGKLHRQSVYVDG